MNTYRVGMPQAMVDFLPSPAKKSQFEITAGGEKGRNWYPDPSLSLSGEPRLLVPENWHHLYMPCKG